MYSEVINMNTYITGNMIKELRDMYNTISFINKDGSFNLVECPQYRTSYLVNKGLLKNGKKQQIEGMSIFPTDYF